MRMKPLCNACFGKESIVFHLCQGVGGYAHPMKGATVRELAAQLGLSPATVSRALNGHSHVAESTRRRVLDAVVRPAQRHGLIFVRCPYELTDYFGPIVSSVGETLRLH